MAYVPTEWETGDVITAAKLNNMETGISNATEAAAAAFVPDITTPANGDVIKYDSTAGKWVNGAASGGGGSLIITLTLNSEAMTLTSDKTAQEIYNAYTTGKFVIAVMGDGAGNDTVMSLMYMGTGSGTADFYFNMVQGTPPTATLLEFYAATMSAYPVCTLST